MPECVTVAEPNFSVTETESTSTITTTSKTIKKIVAPKQKQLKGKIEEQNELLVSLYKMRSLNQLSENDRKELIERGILKDSKKALKKCEQDQARQKIARGERKRKLTSLDDDTREFLTGKKDFTAGRPPSNDENLLIDAISRIGAIKTLNQLTVAL